MAGPDIRIDRVIRVTIWNHQTVSVLIEAGRLYIIRTGPLAAAATGSVLNEGSTLLANILFGGSGGGDATDQSVDEVRDRTIMAAGKRFEKMLTRIADGAALPLEARIAREPAAQLAKGWMSANLPLPDITAATVSETATSRVEGIVPQLRIATPGQPITLRFPQTPKAVVESLAAYLMQR